VGGAIAVLASGIGLGAALLSRFGGRRAVLPAGTAVAPAKSLSRTREPA
jgi:hypothetical protein